MFIVLLFVAIWYLSLFAQTFFLHRYASHGAFTMSKSWEKFFFVFTYLVQGPHYLSPKTYAILHRLHHAHTDTELDPHSPNFSSNMFSMLWRTRKIYNDILRGRVTVEEKYTKNVPEWDFLENIANSKISRFAWVGIYITIFVLFVTSPWQYIFLPVILGMGAFHGAIINWFAHKIGYRNFPLKNTSEI